MSFGTDGRFAAAPAIVAAHRLRLRQRARCSSPRPPTTRSSEQGDPANVLQPTDTGSDINQDLGLR